MSERFAIVQLGIPNLFVFCSTLHLQCKVDSILIVVYNPTFYHQSSPLPEYRIMLVTPSVCYPNEY